MQDTLSQTILATDGRASLALFLYETPQIFQDSILEDFIGFSDGKSFSSLSILKERNVFRIDGKQMLFLKIHRIR